MKAHQESKLACAGRRRPRIRFERNKLGKQCGNCAGPSFLAIKGDESLAELEFEFEFEFEL